MTTMVIPEPGTPSPRDRAQYLAALAVGLAEAKMPDDVAVDELTDAVAGRRHDAQAARRRLYASSLGTLASRKDAVRLLDRVTDRIRQTTAARHQG